MFELPQNLFGYIVNDQVHILVARKTRYNKMHNKQFQCFWQKYKKTKHFSFGSIFLQ